MKSLIFKILRYTGIPFVFRELVQRNKITILLFHDVDKDNAERDFVYLKSHYNLISLRDVVDSITNKDFSGIPHKAALITFDDGHVSNYDLLPIVMDLNIPVTIFLCSGIVGTNRHYWFRHNFDGKPVEDLKRISNQERLRLLSEYGFYQTKSYDDYQSLQDNQIDDMKKYIDFQSHTQYHPVLTYCSNEEAYNEIVESKIQLEQKYGLKINAISYPNGDYSDRDIALAKMAGYECGITVDAGYNDINTDLFRLKRFSVNDAKSIDELMVKATGCYAILKNIFHKPSYGFVK